MPTRIDATPGELQQPPRLLSTSICPPLLMFHMARRPLEFVLEVGRKYDLVYLGWMGVPFYLATGSELVRQMLGDPKRFHKGRIFKKLEIVLGKGLITLDGPRWFDARRRVQQAFSRNLLAEQQQIVIRHTLAMLDRLKAEAKQGPVDLDAVTSDLMVHIALELLFGATPEMIDDLDELLAAIDVCHNYAHYRVWSIVPENWNTRRKREFLHALGCLESFIDRIIAARERESQAELRRHCDVLSLLFDGGFRGVELRDHVMTMFIAGYETTATALSFLFGLLARHPGIQDQLYEEVCDLPHGSVPLDALPLVKAVWDETLRLYPPVPMLDRVPTEDVRLGAYQVPAGANIIWSPYCMHRKYFPNPECFDPGRFLDGAKLERGDFIPFGGGPRMCIGKFLADMEAVTVAALFGRAFRIQPVEAGEIPVRPMLTIRPEGGINVRLDPRRLPTASHGADDSLVHSAIGEN